MKRICLSLFLVATLFGNMFAGPVGWQKAQKIGEKFFSNVLGQRLIEMTADGGAALNLGNYGSGMYLLRIETAEGVMLQKVNVRK